MDENTIISLFLSYPIGLAVNATSDKIKQMSKMIRMDDREPLKKVFINSFIRAIEEHDKYYDVTFNQITRKLIDFVKLNPDKVINIFIQSSSDKDLLYNFQDVDFRQTVSKKIAETLNVEFEALKLETLLQPIIFDCFSFYRNAFFKYINEKEGIIALLTNTLEMRQEIDKIAKTLEKYNNTSCFFDKYVAYKFSILNKFREVNFFGLGLDRHKRKKKRELIKIYVKPRFRRIDKDYFINLKSEINLKVSELIDITDLDNIPGYFQERNEPLPFEKLLDGNTNLVILGDPGAGKSILVKYIMSLIANDNLQAFENKEILNHIPFRVELRKYIKDKRSTGCSIISYLESILRSEYQIDFGKSPNLIELFDIQKCIVFFDGLDEIFDVSEKIEVRDDIQNFLAQHMNVKIVVTSRIIGYEDAKFNDTFTEVRILNFNDTQIKEYVTNWYLQDCDEIKLAENMQIDSLRNEIRGLEDELKRNPLLLSLIIILYQNNGQLPSSKLELYKSCTKTLVDNWDQLKELDIKINDDVKKRKENIFSSLALWQYIESSKQSTKINIDNRSVLKQVGNTIFDLELTSDLIEAEKLACEFIDYAEKRSLYFDNTFTHKTFWEYYAALRLFQQFYLRKDPHLENLIREYIGKSFWYNVLELLFNMIDEVQCDNKELKDLMEKFINRNPESLPFFLKVAPSLTNITINTRKQLIMSSMTYCITSLSKTGRDSKIAKTCYAIFENLNIYLEKGINIDEIQNSYDEIYSFLNNEQQYLYYYAFCFEINQLPRTNKLVIHSTDLNKFVTANPKLFNDYFFQSKHSLDYIVNKVIEFANLFGQRELFKDNSFYFSRHSFRVSIADHYYRRQLEDLDTFVPNMKLLKRNKIKINRFSNRFSLYIEKEVSFDEVSLVRSIYEWDILSLLLKTNKFKFAIKKVSPEQVVQLFSEHPFKDRICKIISKYEGSGKEAAILLGNGANTISEKSV